MVRSPKARVLGAFLATSSSAALSLVSWPLKELKEHGGPALGRGNSTA